MGRYLAPVVASGGQTADSGNLSGRSRSQKDTSSCVPHMRSEKRVVVVVVVLVDAVAVAVVVCQAPLCQTVGQKPGAEACPSNHLLVPLGSKQGFSQQWSLKWVASVRTPPHFNMEFLVNSFRLLFWLS